MQSKISFFNKMIIRKNLTRFWPLWAVYAFIWFLILPFGVMNSCDGIESMYHAMAMHNYVLQTTNYAVPVMSFLYSIVVAVAVFSYMHSSKSISLYHSIPVSREGLFTSSYVSGIIFSVGPHLLVAIITCVIGATMGNWLIPEVLAWLYSVTCTSVLFFSIGVLCGTLTGHVIIQPVVYVIFNFLVVVVESVVRAIGSLMLFGVSNTGTTLGFLSPVYELLTQGVSSYRYVEEIGFGTYEMRGWGILGIYLVAGIAIGVGALLIYRRRRSEAAGDVVAVNCLKPVFKYCLSFGMAITCGLLLFAMFNSVDGTGMATSEFAALVVWMLISAAVGYIAGEMLVKKSLRVFTGKTFGKIGIVAVVVIVAMGMTRADVFNIEDRMPDAQDVLYVAINNSYYYSADVNDVEELGAVFDLHQTVIDNKDEIISSSKNATYLYNDAESYTEQTDMSLYITYTLKNGRQLERTYYRIPVTESIENDKNTVVGKYMALCNTPEQILRRMDLGEGYDIVYASIEDTESYHLDFNQAQRLYEAMRKDAEQGNIGKIWAISGKKFNEEYCVQTISIDAEIDEEDGTKNCRGIYIDLTKSAANTLAVLEDIGYDMSRIETYSERYMRYAEESRLENRSVATENVIIY